MPNTKRLGRLIEQKVLWKYFCLILVLIVLIGYLSYEVKDAFTIEKISNGLLYSVVTSLIVSLFYDISTRRDVAMLIDEEREQQRLLLSNRFLAAIDLERLPKPEAEELAGQLARNDRMMELVSLSLLGEQGRSFFYTWLKPLVEKRLVYNVVIENRLSPIPGRNDAYSLTFSQTFRAPAGKKSYALTFAYDNDLISDLVTSEPTTDEVVGTSKEEWDGKDGIDQQVKSLHFQAHRNHLGERQEVVIPPRVIRGAELATRLQAVPGPPVSEQLVRRYEFDLQPDDDWSYEFSYSVNNRLSDHYYNWISSIPMFIDKLVINYGDLKSLVGPVAANTILGSTLSKPQHDKRTGVYSVNIGSLLWPGQGAMIVWQPPTVPLSSPSVGGRAISPPP